MKRLRASARNTIIIQYYANKIKEYFLMNGIEIIGTGSYVPEFIADNNRFAEFLDTSDEWITPRTGIKQRHIMTDKPNYFMATEAAKKNLIQVPVLKGTIPHEQYAKFGGSQVYIQPATHGTGVKAGGAMRAVLESVGIKDVLAKSKGSSNPHNLVKATILALSQMRDAFTVAGTRGISMEKVFRG